MDQKITERVLMRGTSLLRRIRIPLYSRTARFKRGDEVALMELTFLWKMKFNGGRWDVDLLNESPSRHNEQSCQSILLSFQSDGSCARANIKVNPGNCTLELFYDSQRSISCYTNSSHPLNISS